MDTGLNPCRTRGESVTLPGKMTVRESQNLRIHTFAAPDDGWSVNSHIIEFPTQLIIIDAQYMLPDAQDLKCLRVLCEMVGAIGFEPMTSTV